MKVFKGLYFAIQAKKMQTDKFQKPHYRLEFECKPPIG